MSPFCGFPALCTRGVAVVLLAVSLAACSSDETQAAVATSTGGTPEGGAGAGGVGAGGAGGVSAESGSHAGGTGGNSTGGAAPVGGSAGTGGTASPPPTASVLQHHKNATRNGVYVDAAFTKQNAAKMHRDLAFDAPIDGMAYGQVLFFENGPGGKDVVLAATQNNQVSAFDATTGVVVWQRIVAPPARYSNFICGNYDPVGVTGTPVIDEVSRTMFLDAMTLQGGAPKHMIYALSIDDGSTRPGWPVDVSASVKFNGVAFDSKVQGQRGALVILNGNVYVPYGGFYGDCGNYRGWVVGVPMNDPKSPIGWATRALGGGSWGHGGLASDGTSLYVSTGNTHGNTDWADGEAVIRLPSDLKFSKAAADYFAPTNWKDLDNADLDLGGSGPLLFDAPGATPSELVVGLGKNGYAYLLDRKNLGGIGAQLDAVRVSAEPVVNAAAAYTTSKGTYFATNRPGIGCPGPTARITAVLVSATSPPKLSVAWCQGGNGYGSPMVTTTNGKDETIVWWLAAERDGLLRGYDGDTGDIVYAGGAAAESAGARRFQSPIAAKGRMYIAGDLRVVAYTMK